MGRESKVKKDRKCRDCGRLVRWDSKSILDHSFFCKRLGKIGLIRPGNDLISDPLEGRKIILP